MSESICGFPREEWLQELTYGGWVHWSGLTLHHNTLSFVADQDVIAEALRVYLSHVLPAEQARRRAAFAAYQRGREAVEALNRWLRDAVGFSTDLTSPWWGISLDEKQRRVVRYVRDYSEYIRIQPEQLTDAVPEEMRRAYAEGLAAIDAWRRSVPRLFVRFERDGRFVHAVIEEVKQHG